MRKRLRKLGYEVGQSGSHLKVGCGECQPVVPVHTGEMGKGMLRSIARDLEPCLGKKWMNK